MTQAQINKIWQKDYEQATRKTGKVLKVFGLMGEFGGIALWVEVKDGNLIVYYSPYLDQDPDLAELERFERSEDLWLSNMTGAANWGSWDWGKPETDYSVLKY